MKTIITLAILLFVYPWDNTGKDSNQVLYEGTYTITGKSYNSKQTYDSPMACQTVYLKIYKTKLVATMSEYGTGQYKDIEYKFEKIDDEGNRIYRSSIYDAFVVNAEYDVQRVYSTYTHNGNVRTDNFCEVVKGDFSADCMQRMEDEMNRQRNQSMW